MKKIKKVLSIVLTACLVLGFISFVYNNKAKAAENSRIAFIGDSIVAINDWNNLFNRNDCDNYGIGGEITTQVAARFDSAVCNGEYSKIFILCGINDLWQITLEQSLEAYEQMVKNADEKVPNAKVYAISILPTSDAYYTGMQYLITDFNAGIKEIASRYDNTTFIDCYSSFLGADGYCIPEYTYDGLHPNSTGYQVIGKILEPYINDTVIEEPVETETPTETEEPVETETPTETEEPTQTEIPTDTALTATIKVVNAWNTGYVADITITNNTSSTINSWKVDFVLKDEITNLWNGNLTSSGNNYSVTGLSWNSTIAPGQSITIGFMANKSETNAVAATDIVVY